MSHWLHINTIDGVTPSSPGLVETLTAYQTFCTPIFTIPLVGCVIGLGPHLHAHFDGDRRLHCAGGSAIGWPDGTQIFAWHGTRVPAWAIEDADPLAKIQAEPNTEIRRCAIERWGWDRYLGALGVVPVDECADPGNPGHKLRLFDLPPAAQVFGAPVRLYVMVNASRDRDGTRRVYAETVPADVPDAVAAAAWAFGVSRDVYAAMARAT